MSTIISAVITTVEEKRRTTRIAAELYSYLLFMKNGIGVMPRGFTSIRTLRTHFAGQYKRI